MRYSMRLTNAVHILCYIEIFKEKELSSEAIGESLLSHPSSIRKIMSDLKKSGLLVTKRGKAAPRLNKEPDRITLYDIYQSLGEREKLLRGLSMINPNCHIGMSIQEAVIDNFCTLQNTCEDKMKTIYLSEIIESVKKKNKKYIP